MTIKVAVIGVGSMGKNHARVYSELAEAELVALADTNQQVVDQAGRLYTARAYADYRQMLAREKPQAVSIAVPTNLHEEIAQAVLESGADLLVEKPIAASLTAANCLVERAISLNRRLMVGHILRFNPAVQALKKKLNSGELGQIFQITTRRVGPFPDRIRDVGVVIDLAPHDLDLMRYLTDLEPVRVYAETSRRIHTDHEDLLSGLLHFPDHITGALEINWLTPTKVREINVLGERGLFRVNDLTQDLYFFANAQADSILWSNLQNIKGVSEGSMIRYAIQRYEPLKAELQAFLSSIIQDTDVPVTGNDGIKALKLALALVESGKTHQVIEV